MFMQIPSTQITLISTPRGGGLPYQSGGGVPPEPHGAHGEREIKKFRVTKRELLNNLSNIHNFAV